MSQDGYTAAEALAALAIVGFAIGGLTVGLQVIGATQARASAALAGSVSLAAAERSLADLFRGRGPFRSDRAGTLTGAPAAFSFPCGAASCGAELDGGVMVVHGADGAARSITLPQASAARFAYVSALGTTDTWPPSQQPPPPAPQWEVLRGVTVLAGDAGAAVAPVLTTRLWTEESIACEFDSVLQDCRAGTQ